MSLAMILAGYAAIGVIAGFLHVHLKALAAARTTPAGDEGTLLGQVWERPSSIAMTVFVIASWPLLPIFFMGTLLAQLAIKLAVLRLGRASGEARSRNHLCECDAPLKTERMLLGSLMLRHDLISRVLKIVRAYYFSRSSHAAIYGAIIRLWRRDEDCNPATIADELRGDGFLAEVGGMAYLVALEHEAGNPENAVRLARLVETNARRRGIPPASPPIHPDPGEPYSETPGTHGGAPHTKSAPYDTEAEIALLGALVLNNRLIDRVIFLDADAFYYPRNAAIFVAIREVYADRKSCDLVTLKSELERRGMLEKVGGVDYLANLVETAPSAASALQYAQIVYSKWALRQLSGHAKR